MPERADLNDKPLPSPLRFFLFLLVLVEVDEREIRDILRHVVVEHVLSELRELAIASLSSPVRRSSR
jgi:hypothetical protein